MWLLPSLRRPHLVKRFFEAYKEANGSTPGIIIVDENDPGMFEYKSIEMPGNWGLVITKSRLMADKVHEVWERYKDADWVGILNDDHIPRTKDWDKIIVQNITGHNVIFTNDNWTFGKSPRLCGAICFSGPIIRELGYVFPGKIKHLYSDDAWSILFSNARCLVGLRDVVVEHDHAYKNQSAQDETFKEINGADGLKDGKGTGGLWASDKDAFDLWQKDNLKGDLLKVVKLQPKNGLMIATPYSREFASIRFMNSVFNTMIDFGQRNIPCVKAEVVGSSLLAMARNGLAKNLLDSSCKKILFVDDDHPFTPQDVLTLYGSSRPIVAGISPHKRLPINLNFIPKDEDRHFFKSMTTKNINEARELLRCKGLDNGEVEVARAGTGFMMIDRTVFEAMIEHVDSYLAYEERSDMHYEFFKTGKSKETGLYAGEDWLLCELARKLGFKVFVNMNVMVQHIGTFAYDGRILVGDK